MPRPRIAVITSGLAIALAVTLGGGGSASASTGVTPNAGKVPGSGTFRAVPQARLVNHRFAAPPTTADCQASIGINCYGPTQFETAYDLPALYRHGLAGQGRTIAIVDSFGSPTIKADLAKFDADYGLPAPPKFDIIQPAGAVPPWDPNNSDMVGWAEETSLDVEYAHAIAPGANILLVETPVAETEGVTGFPEIVKAENYVIDHNLADVISQSFGATEETFPSQQALLQLRSAFLNAARHQVTVLGASGDAGPTDYMVDGRPPTRWSPRSAGPSCTWTPMATAPPRTTSGTTPRCSGVRRPPGAGSASSSPGPTTRTSSVAWWVGTGAPRTSA